MPGHELWQPGNRITDARLDSGDLIGRLVFVAVRATAQSISNNNNASVSNAIAWDQIDLDLLDGWDVGQPTRFQPPVAGWYLLAGGIGFASSSTGNSRGGAWALNGFIHPGSHNKRVTNSTIVGVTLSVPAMTIPVFLDGVSDYVEMVAQQNSGSALNTLSGETQASIHYSGP